MIGANQSQTLATDTVEQSLAFFHIAYLQLLVVTYSLYSVLCGHGKHHNHTPAQAQARPKPFPACDTTL